MKIVDSIPGKPIYPWGEWFDGQARLLEPGVDYTSDPAVVRSAASNAARKAGVKIVTRIRPEGVYIQALDPAVYTVRAVSNGGDSGDGDDRRRDVA